MTRQERIDLATMRSCLPELKVLRNFVDRLVILFEEGQSEVLARGRHTALVVNRHFLGVLELATELEMLATEKFVKMIAFLKSQVCRRMRTNNHVERVNRKPRYEEKSRYKWGGHATRRCGSWCCCWTVMEARTSDLEPLA